MTRRTSYENGRGHGGGVRGEQQVAHSQFYQGRFGRIFRSLPAASWPRTDLASLADGMTALPETTAGEPSAAEEFEDKRIHDEEENIGIAAGYTYFGQFVDHDITFDPASSLQQQNDPEGLIDFRTPRLDLDSLYGRGPKDQPYLYDGETGRKFRLGRALTFNDKPSTLRDVPRWRPEHDGDKAARKTALIGDKRNDENVIVSQLHAAFLQFHNRLADLHPDYSFERVQQEVRWHYQWLVVNDYLRKICKTSVVDDILRPPNGKIWKGPRFRIYKWKRDAFMPIEFSAAAFRFGHSMVRPVYRLNTELNGGAGEVATKEEEKRGLAGRFFIFAGVQKRGLNGFDEFPAKWAIDWSLFFDIDGSGSKPGKQRVQPSYKIDTSLVNPLGFLPEFSTTPIADSGVELTLERLQSKASDPVADPSNLALRNLLRGLSMGLPSGQAVARSLGLEPVPDEELWVGKATLVDSGLAKSGLAEPEQPPRLDKFGASFKDNAPLWYYVLAEAQADWRKEVANSGNKEAPVCLGEVGSRIVAETLIGLLWADGHSYLRQDPLRKPSPTIRTVGDLIKFALVQVAP